MWSHDVFTALVCGARPLHLAGTSTKKDSWRVKRCSASRRGRHWLETRREGRDRPSISRERCAPPTNRGGRVRTNPRLTQSDGKPGSAEKRERGERPRLAVRRRPINGRPSYLGSSGPRSTMPPFSWLFQPGHESGSDGPDLDCQQRGNETSTPPTHGSYGAQAFEYAPIFRLPRQFVARCAMRRQAALRHARRAHASTSVKVQVATFAGPSVMQASRCSLQSGGGESARERREPRSTGLFWLRLGGAALHRLECKLLVHFKF